MYYIINTRYCKGIIIKKNSMSKCNIFSTLFSFPFLPFQLLQQNHSSISSSHWENRSFSRLPTVRVRHLRRLLWWSQAEPAAYACELFGTLRLMSCTHEVCYNDNLKIWHELLGVNMQYQMPNHAQIFITFVYLWYKMV